MTSPRIVYAGTAIENSKMGSLAGTISFFADLRMVDNGPITQVVVSNEHVLNFGGYASSREFSSPGSGCCGCCCPSNVVGKARWEGRSGLFDKLTLKPLLKDSPVPLADRNAIYLDCAMAPVVPGVKGVNYIPTLYGKDSSGEPLESYLTGTAATPKDGDAVYVATASHGLIPGIYRGKPYWAGLGLTSSFLEVDQYVIDVRRAPKAQRPSLPDGSGDSGSPVINSRNELIGIMHTRTFIYDKDKDDSPENQHGSDVQPAPFIVACPIEKSLDLLKHQTQAFSIVLTPRPPRSTAGEHLYDVPPPVVSPVDVHEPFRRFETLLRRTRLGSALANAGYRHGRELNALVNQCRAVTVAWHRHHGPAWTAHLLKHLREGDHSIPTEIKGVDQRALLEIMRDVLATRGSEALKADLARFAPTLLELAGSADAGAALAQLAVIDGAPHGAP